MEKLGVNYCDYLRKLFYSPSDIWRQWLLRSPNDILFSTLYAKTLRAVRAYSQESSQIQRTYAVYPDHHYVEYLYALNNYFNRKNNIGLPILFKLLKGDRNNLFIWNYVGYTLRQYKLWETEEQLLQDWKMRENTYLPLLQLGKFYIKYAWNARGGGWASTVSEQGWEFFRKRVQLAREHLEAGFEKTLIVGKFHFTC